MTTRSGRFRARAKINVGLEVVRRRPDGYHELRTVFQEISLADDVAIRVFDRPGPITVRCDDPRVPSDEGNLAFRAAAAIRSAAPGRADGAIRIDLRKRIPPGGGLGGGSSDAAAVLAGLDRLLRLRLGRARLERLARTLGADVPFFLTGGAALGTGRGDRIRSVRIDVPRFVVLVPGAGGVSTAEVFRAFRPVRRGRSPIRRWLSIHDAERRARACSALVNDLEQAAATVSPRLAAVREMVRDAAASETSAALASMSGSGSAFFVLVASRGPADRIAGRIRAAGFAASIVKTCDRSRSAPRPPRRAP